MNQKRKFRIVASSYTQSISNVQSANGQVKHKKLAKNEKMNVEKVENIHSL